MYTPLPTQEQPKIRVQVREHILDAHQDVPQSIDPSGPPIRSSMAQCPRWPPLRITTMHMRWVRAPMAVMMVCLDRSCPMLLRLRSMRGMVVLKLCALPAHTSP